ncbi:Probable ATP-dependent DNA helicase HFM1 [Eumeta japonica]|uniref:Probable ATP-dependent DNA helicase HFM1 n=1 Tax=Eumeta variegata TaxID=151549 RepID=A0A4C1XGJ7_EUMVA|nr:Probable ATP-dependent DNA helicase HFM1 [Eumeta japonica]
MVVCSPTVAPVKAICTERIKEWHAKFSALGLLCIEVTGDRDVDFSQLKPFSIIITTPEKWDILTRRWRDNKSLVEAIKLFLIDEVHILNDQMRGPVLEAVTSAQFAHRFEQAKLKVEKVTQELNTPNPQIRFIAVSATVSNPEDVAAWLGTPEKPAVYHKFGDECRPVKIKRVVEGYPCSEGASIFKFDILLNYKLWPIIQKYYNGKPTLVFTLLLTVV